MLIYSGKEKRKVRMFLEKMGSTESSRHELKRVHSTYLVGFKTLHSLLLLLFAENDEWATVFVECETHTDCSANTGEKSLVFVLLGE